MRFSETAKEEAFYKQTEKIMGQNTGCHIHKNIKNGIEEEIDA